MKASFGLDLRTCINGRYKVRMRINVNKTTAYLTTGVQVYQEDFDETDFENPIHPRLRRMTDWDYSQNNILNNFAKKYKDVETLLFIEDKLSSVTATEVRDMIDSGNSSKNLLYVEYMYSLSESKATESTRKTVICAANKLRTWLSIRGYGDDIDMRKVTRNMVIDFVEWITSSNMKAASIAVLYMYIRGAWTHAYDRELINTPDPFRGVKLPSKPAKDIETIPVENIRALLEYNPKKPNETMARDFLFIQMLLCGVNGIDIWSMKEESGQVSYVREKTKRKNEQKTHIRIEPELRVLIDMYKGEEYLFSFRERYKNYVRLKQNVRSGLSRIGKQLGFQVSCAMMRRTWATIAEELGVDRVTVDKAMGHVAHDITGRHYAKFNWERVADANRRVIDYVLYGKQ